MKSTIYARYSTDKQRESSIDDQTRLCRQRAQTEGFDITAIYSDDGVSGSMPVSRRSGGAKLIADALAGRFDALIVESLDRLSRDQVEQESLIRRFEHHGIIIIGVSDGYDSRMDGRKIMRGVRGLINELYLDDLRHKTHRGQEGQVARGFLAGGKSYGYNIVKTDKGSRPEINEQEAKQVKWIFSRYAEGWSVQKIAAELNRQGIPSPRGGTWAVSGIYGSPAKGCGILNNEMYIGRYIWNRSQWVKDPDTGNRQRIDRPESEWKITEMPELRIIDDNLWQAVRSRMGEHGKKIIGRKATTLFGGLMRCPYCGGSIIAVSSRLYGCNTRKDRGVSVCKGILFSRDDADKNLLAILQDEMLTDEAIHEIEDQVHAILASHQKDQRDQKNAAENRLKELDAEINRLVDAIACIGLSNALKSRLQAAESERDALQAQQNAQKAINKPIHKMDIVCRIRKKIGEIKTVLTSDTKRARKIIADMLGEIRITEKAGNVIAEYDNATQKLLLVSSGVSLNVVAGARYQLERQTRIIATRKLSPVSVDKDGEKMKIIRRHKDL